jgi:hypothetical protein
MREKHRQGEDMDNRGQREYRRCPASTVRRAAVGCASAATSDRSPWQADPRASQPKLSVEADADHGSGDVTPVFHPVGTRVLG